MRGMLQFLRDDLQAMRRYFRDARAEIAEKNLRQMGAASLFTAALLIAFLLLTPFVIRGWRPSLQHLLFFLPRSRCLPSQSSTAALASAAPKS